MDGVVDLLPGRVGVAGPFALEYLIDPREVHARGRTATSREIARHMAGSAVWSRPVVDVATDRYSDFNAELGERLRDASPDWIASCDADQFLATLLAPDVGLATMSATMGGQAARLTLERAELAISEFGFGAVMLDFAVQPILTVADQPPTTERGREVCDHSLGAHILERLADPLATILAEFGERLPDELKADNLARGIHLLSEGRCLWNHNLLGYRVSPDDERRIAALAALSPSLRPTERVPVGLGSALLIPGLGTTIVTGNGSDWQKSVHIVGLAQAYYAATASTERALMRLTANARTGPMGTGNIVTEQHLAQMHDRIEVANLFAQSLSTMDAHLAASTVEETRAWSAIRQQWAADALLEQIDDHLRNLGTAATHLRNELAARRQRRLNDAAFIFASLAVISTVLDFLDFNQGEPLVTPVVDRFLLSALVLVLLVAGLFYLRRRSD